MFRLIIYDLFLARRRSFCRGGIYAHVWRVSSTGDMKLKRCFVIEHVERLNKFSGGKFSERASKCLRTAFYELFICITRISKQLKFNKNWEKFKIRERKWVEMICFERIRDLNEWLETFRCYNNDWSVRFNLHCKTFLPQNTEKFMS